MSNSLLPPNTTLLERNLEQAINAATDIPVTINTLWDPDRCPAELLPWLAWAYSVDQWRDSWPEIIKRQTIKESFVIHQHKGTPFAVQHALNALGIKTQIREWWEDGVNGQPGTMKVLALINENLSGDADGLLTSDMMQLITDAISAAKRGSIHFDLELGLSFEESLCISGALHFGIGIVDTAPPSIPVTPNEIIAETYTTLVEHSVYCPNQQLNGLAILPDATLLTITFAAVSNVMLLSDLTLTGEY